MNHFIKALVFLALAYALYRNLSGRLSDLDSRPLLAKANYIYLLGVVLLMPVNWILEAMKWRRFLAEPFQLSFAQALKAVITGVTFSMFTPYQTGDYIGRVLAVQPEKNGPVVLATLAGSMCQLAVLLFFGWFGLLYFGHHSLTLTASDYKYFLIFGLLGTIVAFLIIIYIRPLLYFALRQKVLQRYEKSLAPIKYMLAAYDRRTFGKALGLAGLRYFVYLSQYVLLLLFGKVAVPLLLAYAGVASIFLLQSSVPLPPALSLLARGEVALLFWSPYASDPVPILLASFGLFIINLVLPSLVGLGIVLRINVLKSLGYEKTKS